MFDFDEIDDDEDPAEEEAAAVPVGDDSDAEETRRALEDLGDGDKGVRWDACRAFAKMGLIAVPCLPAIERMADAEGDDDVRRAAKQALRKLKGEAGQERVPPAQRGGRYGGRAGRAAAAEAAVRAKEEVQAAAAAARAAAEAEALQRAARNVEEDTDEEEAAVLEAAAGRGGRRVGRFGQVLKQVAGAEDGGASDSEVQPREVYFEERDRPNDASAYYLAPEAEEEEVARPALHHQGLDAGTSGITVSSFSYLAEKEGPKAKVEPDVSWDLVEPRAVFKIFESKTKFALLPMRLEREGLTTAEVASIWETRWGVQYASRVKFEALPDSEDGDSRRLRRDDPLPAHPAMVRLEAGGSILYTLAAALREYGKLSLDEAAEAVADRQHKAEIGAQRRAKADAKEGAKYKHMEMRRNYDARNA